MAFRLIFLDNIPQDAYGTLSDPAKRREYDSVDEFDDSLPLECASTDFFKV
jgi:DnaJ homolog subfamily C member 2